VNNWIRTRKNFKDRKEIFFDCKFVRNQEGNEICLALTENYIIFRDLTQEKTIGFIKIT
jgi:hypothetical protein